MRKLLKEIAKKKKIISQNSIDKQFPNPKKNFIVGFTDEDKKRECQTI